MSRMVRLDEWLTTHCKTNRTNGVPARDVQRLGPIRKNPELGVALKGLQELDRLRIRTDGKHRVELNPMLLG